MGVTGTVHADTSSEGLRVGTRTHIAAIADEGQRLADAARRAGLDTPVPTCPGWDTRELLRHLGLIHLWAASHVSFPHEQPVLADEAEQRSFTGAFWPGLGTFWVDDYDLVDWYLRTNANLVDALSSASPDLEAWTFLPAPNPLAMWARRQAHETAIHRYDAEAAAGTPSGFEGEFASDGVDEILRGMTTRRRLDQPVSDPQSLAVHAVDVDDRWHVTLDSDRVEVVRGEGPADGTVSGDASDLYLALWNRTSDSALHITGDRRALDTWHSTFRVRWYQKD